MKGPMGIGMRLRRLQPGRAVAAARLRLVASLPSLDPAGSIAHPQTVYVGPVVPVSPPVPARVDSDPLVLVSLNTVRFPRMSESLQTILDACAGLDARVVVATGPVVDPADLQAARNTEVHRYRPHAELMPTASLLVGHGGHSTTMQALAHDLPMVLMHPMLDQPMVARTVEAAGAGRVVRKKATADELAPVIAGLLGDGPHRQAAAALGAEIRARPGATNAADRIEDILTTATQARPRPAVMLHATAPPSSPNSDSGLPSLPTMGHETTAEVPSCRPGAGM
jgi:UDP:flavonoid glycosyltransferase YjiC (YdhE family)